MSPRVWARPCTVSGHCCAVGLPACSHPSYWKPWREAQGSLPAGLAANDTPMAEAGSSLEPLPAAWGNQRWSPRMPCSAGCGPPPLLCGDSVSTNHQLGGSASGREVSQGIIHRKGTNPSWIWTSVSYVTPFRKHGIVGFPNQFPAIQGKNKRY